MMIYLSIHLYILIVDRRAFVAAAKKIDHVGSAFGTHEFRAKTGQFTDEETAGREAHFDPPRLEDSFVKFGEDLARNLNGFLYCFPLPSDKSFFFSISLEHFPSEKLELALPLLAHIVEHHVVARRRFV